MTSQEQIEANLNQRRIYGIKQIAKSLGVKTEAGKQVITITIDLAANQKPYELFERDGYLALFHFFQDINYAVSDINTEVGE